MEISPALAHLDPEAVKRAHAHAAALMASAQIEEKRGWCPHRPSPKQRLFLQLQDKEALYGGAAFGGKSDALLMGAIWYWDEKTKTFKSAVDIPGYAAILFRRTFTDLTLSESLIPRSHEWFQGTGAKWHEDASRNIPAKTWVFPSGATITFAYLDSENDRFRYQSAAFHYVAFDELTQFSDTMYLYLFSRLRRLKNMADIPLRMRSGTNPGGIGAQWVMQRFIPDGFIAAEHAHEVRAWHKEFTNEDGDVIKTVFVPATKEDNNYGDISSYNESLIRLDKVTREQLGKGDWSIKPTGRMRFNAAAIDKFKPRAPDFGDGELYEEEDGPVKYMIFRPTQGGVLAVWKKPETGRMYVIGADSAEGRDRNDGKGSVNPDYSVAQVRDINTGEQVARLRGRLTERAFGQYLYVLGKWFNWAYVVPEVTGGHGIAMLDKLIDMGYPMTHIYSRREEQKVGVPPKYDELGWQTTTVTRPRMISHLDGAIIEQSIATYDAVTINEYRYFEIWPNGDVKARAGMHDDAVFADALCIMGIERAPRLRLVETDKPVNLSPRYYGQQQNQDRIQRRWSQM